MNIEEIQQAVTKLSPDELGRFRTWFKKYESNVNVGELNDSQESFEETLKRLRGSLKGKGVLKTLMEERRKESLL
jgi:ribosomal protein S20